MGRHWGEGEREEEERKNERSEKRSLRVVKGSGAAGRARPPGGRGKGDVVRSAQDRPFAIVRETSLVTKMIFQSPEEATPAKTRRRKLWRIRVGRAAEDSAGFRHSGKQFSDFFFSRPRVEFPEILKGRCNSFSTSRTDWNYLRFGG